MKVVTIATDLENPFLKRLLIPSCQAVGLRLTILYPAKERFQLADKRVVLGSYLSQLADRDELVLFTDAYDTVFIRGEAYIEQTYADFSRRIVFSGELNSWPLAAIGYALYDSPPAAPYPYLNSGGLVGTAGDLLDLCRKYPKPPSDRFTLLSHLREHGYDTDQRYGFSDQYFWTLVYLLERHLIELDHGARLFEYFGPPMPDIVPSELAREYDEFCELGRRTESYQREHARLQERLKTPSSAAQVHFASPITEAVALDLRDNRQLPEWLHAAYHPVADGESVQVREL